MFGEITLVGNYYRHKRKCRLNLKNADQRSKRKWWWFGRAMSLNHSPCWLVFLFGRRGHELEERELRRKEETNVTIMTRNKRLLRARVPGRGNASWRKTVKERRVDFKHCVQSPWYRKGARRDDKYGGWNEAKCWRWEEQCSVYLCQQLNNPSSALFHPFFTSTPYFL